MRHFSFLTSSIRTRPSAVAKLKEKFPRFIETPKKFLKYREFFLYQIFLN